jgi:hypothetical protein
VGCHNAGLRYRTDERHHSYNGWAFQG